MRRGEECLPPRGPAFRSESVAVTPNDLARELHELIAALDRRVPRVEEAGEAAIARDAAALREKAVQRLRELDELSKVAAFQASDGSSLT
jgi:hypothetical protein